MKPEFNLEEFENLKNEYGKNAVIKEAVYSCNSSKYFSDFENKIKTDRRGEVVFFVQRKNGKFIMVRTSFYPPDIYRVPTGGISYGEKAIDALLREVKEELGLVVCVKEFLGVLVHKISCGTKKTINFYSYAFHLTEIGGTILKDATEDEISEFTEVDLNGIRHICTTLKNTNGKWKDWCNFRRLTTEFILKED